MGGRFKREGTDVYRWLIHIDVWWKPTQYCKAIILKLKINKFLKSEWGEREEVKTLSASPPQSVPLNPTVQVMLSLTMPHEARDVPSWCEHCKLPPDPMSFCLIVLNMYTHTHTHFLFRFKGKNDSILIWTKYWRTYFWFENYCLILYAFWLEKHQVWRAYMPEKGMRRKEGEARRNPWQTISMELCIFKAVLNHEVAHPVIPGK